MRICEWKECGAEFEPKRGLQRFCTPKHQRMAWEQRNPRETLSDRREFISKGNRGAWAESVAVAYLIERGWDAFTNVSAHGPVDIVAFDGENIVLLDVKTRTTWIRKDGSVGISNGPTLTQEQRDMGVEILYVRADTGNVEWEFK